jgi:hypothetical protein
LKPRWGDGQSCSDGSHHDAEKRIAPHFTTMENSEHLVLIANGSLRSVTLTDVVRAGVNDNFGWGGPLAARY